MATAISGLIGYIRTLLADTDSSFYRWIDAVITNAVKVALLTNADYSAVSDTIEPTVASDNDMALIIYEAAIVLLNPTEPRFSYRTRNLSVSRESGKRDMLAEFGEKVWEIKNGADNVFVEDGSLLAWLERADRLTDRIAEADRSG